eukprot:9503907-Pyramimonas_sp.AAC.2
MSGVCRMSVEKLIGGSQLQAGPSSGRGIIPGCALEASLPQQDPSKYNFRFSKFALPCRHSIGICVNCVSTEGANPQFPFPSETLAGKN